MLVGGFAFAKKTTTFVKWSLRSFSTLELGAQGGLSYGQRVLGGRSFLSQTPGWEILRCGRFDLKRIQSESLWQKQIAMFFVPLCGTGLEESPVPRYGTGGLKNPSVRYSVQQGRLSLICRIDIP